jgi:secreted Zn-dependent insulinase-like peptidase
MDFELATEVERNFAEIIKEEYLFDRREREIEYLEKVTKKDLLDFYDRHFTPQNTRNISIHVLGPNQEKEVASDDEEEDEDNKPDEDVIDIKNIQEFKDSLQIYPTSKTNL